jgi:phospholipid-transporting ATPase
VYKVYNWKRDKIRPFIKN